MMYLGCTLATGCGGSFDEMNDSTLIIYNPDGSIFLELHNSSTDIGSLEGVNAVGSLHVKGKDHFMGNIPPPPRARINANFTNKCYN